MSIPQIKKKKRTFPQESDHLTKGEVNTQIKTNPDDNYTPNFE